MTHYCLCLLLVVSALSGCGGGGGSSAGMATPHVACVPVTGPINVAVFGDSTSMGYTMVGDYPGGPPTHYVVAAEKPPTLLQAELDARLGAGQARVIDRAHGWQLATLAEGRDGLNATWPSPVVETRAHIAVLAYGINDQSQQETTPAAYRALLVRMIEQARPAVVMVQTPIGAEPFAVRDVAPVIEAARYAETRSADLPDGAHPSQQLYRDLARDVIGPAVADQVRALRCL